MDKNRLDFKKQIDLKKYSGESYIERFGKLLSDCTEKEVPKIKLSSPFSFEKFSMLEILGKDLPGVVVRSHHTDLLKFSGNFNQLFFEKNKRILEFNRVEKYNMLLYPPI